MYPGSSPSWWLPAAVACAFGTYVINTWLLPHTGETTQTARRIGHIGGVCNYVLIGILVCNNTAEIRLLSPDVLHWFFLLVPAYSGAAVLAGVIARRGALVNRRESFARSP